MNDCLFCKIINGEITSDKIYEDEYVIAFHDIFPQAPVHILIVPKEHIESAADINTGNSYLTAKCFEVVSLIAKNEKLDTGFRVITNSGKEGGQTIFHLHFHLLGGKTFDRVGD